MLSLRPVVSIYTEPYILAQCLKVESHHLSCLTFTKLLQTESLHGLPASALLPPLLAGAREVGGAQHCSPGWSGALYYPEIQANYFLSCVLAISWFI